MAGSPTYSARDAFCLFDSLQIIAIIPGIVLASEPT